MGPFQITYYNRQMTPEQNDMKGYSLRDLTVRFYYFTLTSIPMCEHRRTKAGHTVFERCRTCTHRGLEIFMALKLSVYRKHYFG
jgi:hypothetical protein